MTPEPTDALAMPCSSAFGINGLQLSPHAHEGWRDD